MSMWETIELLGYTYFSEKGWRILCPLVKNEGYDFVAEKEGDFIRVNVKLAGLKCKSEPNSWSVSVASGSGKKAVTDVRCDLYLVWVPTKHKFVELPGDFFLDNKSKSKRIPRKYLEG